MPSNKRNNSSTSKSNITTTKDSSWTKWMSSFFDGTTSSSYQQENKPQPPKLPQHELRHSSSLPNTPTHFRFQEEEKHPSLGQSHFLTRSSSYALKRTGTLSQVPPPQRLPCVLNCDSDDDEEEDLEVRRSSPCWAPPPPPRMVQVQQQPRQPSPKKLVKRVSFSAIQIYTSTTESLSPSSSLTSFSSQDDSPRDGPPVTMSIDAFEAGKPTDLNPIPYHLRFSPPPEMPRKEELRQSNSLFDHSKRKKLWRRPSWKKLRSFSSRKSSRRQRHEEEDDENVPIRVFDATDPTVARHINMAGVVSRSQYTCYEDVY